MPSLDWKCRLWFNQVSIVPDQEFRKDEWGGRSFHNKEKESVNSRSMICWFADPPPWWSPQLRLLAIHLPDEVHQQGDPTDLLWSKKSDVTNREIQLTTFGPKNVTVTNTGIQLTSFDPKNVTSPTGRSNWPPLMQKTWSSPTGGSNWPGLHKLWYPGYEHVE